LTALNSLSAEAWPCQLGMFNDDDNDALSSANSPVYYMAVLAMKRPTHQMLPTTTFKEWRITGKF